MPYNVYEFSIETMLKTTNSLILILQNVDTLKASKDLTDEQIVTARLALDMFPFAKQIQIVSDNLKGATSRLAGIEAPMMEDTETTLAELIERLKKTVEYAQSVSASALQQAEERLIIVPRFSDKPIKPYNYMRDYGLPNFFFHVVTAYNILRHLGFELGKGQYLGPVEFEK
jgi:uncharacterized protein